MASAKHTPGPWVTNEGAPHVRVVGSRRHANYKSGEKRIPICNLLTTCTTQPEVLANARLIAAAPDLLAALKRARNYLDGQNCYPDVLALIDGAIAKAEGIHA